MAVLEHIAPQLSEELVAPLDAADAPLEADRCLECGGPYAAAPCVVACPAEVDVPSFVESIASGDVYGAAATIFAANILGASCARVCPAEMLCEGACVLLHEGRRPIEIARLQRFATDAARDAGLPLRVPVPSNGRPVAVIGAGPAGLACAGELAARGYEVTVYDAREEIGGLVRFAIAPYRLQQEPLPDEHAALAALGVRFELGTEIDCVEALRSIEESADAVFLAVGLGKDVELDLPGAELPGVWQSLPFIEALKTGQPPRIGNRVVVLGGGNTAIDVAREARRLGASCVTLVYRRTEVEMPAYAHEVGEARDEGVHFRWLSAPVRFRGKTQLTGVECVEMRLGEPDGSGRRRPEPIAGSDFTIPADVAVTAIGQQPRADFLRWIDGLELDRGLVKIDAHGRTANPKYFAGGDAVNGGATVVEAVREAKVAAAGIDSWLARRRQ
jgi:glutamate synthase (NADPH/NADH) small chain